MDFLKYAKKLESLQYYIESNSCVNVDSLTQRLEVSRRTVLRMVENLRLQGINITYCNRQKKYIIKKSG
jgi:predicted DNA-binding transcriptional regulator YafY